MEIFLRENLKAVYTLDKDVKISKIENLRLR